jgi:hypothetical protein
MVCIRIVHRAIATLRSLPASARAGYYESFLLPENVTMVYASADTDRDSLQGVLIRARDRSSRFVLEEIRKRNALPPMRDWYLDQNCAGIAKINFLREGRGRGPFHSWLAS